MIENLSFLTQIALGFVAFTIGKEIPILDDEKRVVADLTIVDLLKFYKSVKGRDL